MGAEYNAEQGRLRVGARRTPTGVEVTARADSAAAELIMAESHSATATASQESASRQQATTTKRDGGWWWPIAGLITLILLAAILSPLKRLLK